MGRILIVDDELRVRDLIKKYAKEKKIKVKCVQSNYEGKIVEYIQKSINKSCRNPRPLGTL